MKQMFECSGTIRRLILSCPRVRSPALGLLIHRDERSTPPSSSPTRSPQRTGKTSYLYGQNLPQPPRIHILMILLTVAWMCGSHQRQQLEDIAGAETITLSSSRNNRSRPILSRERGFMVLTMQAKQNTYNGESHISLPNFGKASEENRDQQQGPRTSVRKSNLKVPHCAAHCPCLTQFSSQVPSGGVRLVGLSHTARNNAMV